MIELLENTLNILTKVTNSKTALLLRFGSDKNSIVHVSGSKASTFKEFNDVLFNLFLNSKFDEIEIENHPVCKSILNKLNVESCFIQNVLSIKERDESFYLFLFLNDIEINIHSVNSLYMKILSILGTQLKNYFFESLNHNQSITTSATSTEDDLILKNRNDNFNNLMSLSNDLIFFLDRNGCFLKVSQSCSLILDYSDDEIKGKHFLDIIPADHKTKVAFDINKIFQSERVLKFSAVVENKLGKEIPFNFSCHTITRNSEIIGLMGVGTDISRLKQSEEELLKLKPKLTEAQRLISIERARLWQQTSLLEELDRIKSEFVSNISHEFRTPLASIIGFSETIVSDPDLPEEMKSEFNHVILNEGKRLAKLINDVLDLSNIEGGKIALNKSSTNIVDLVKQVVENYRVEAEKKMIVMDFEHPAEKVIIDADGEKLGQSIEALISNAIKFTNEDGRVKVIVNNLFKEAEIIISDTGVGIPEKDLPYIFQKFYRVSRPGTEIPGTGIGLVFVKQMVDMHKGLISVQSELGSGTTFIIKFLKSFKVNS
ncbi:ATP-binding protein [Bacteroidota bacterium]